MIEYLIDKHNFNRLYKKLLSGSVFHREYDEKDVTIRFVSKRVEHETIDILSMEENIKLRCA